MKLYATVTSERATKGQGGNDRLDIAITVENPYTGKRETLTNIEVYPMKYKNSISYVVNNGGDEFIASTTFYDTKLQGEKQSLKDANMNPHATPFDVLRNSKRIIEIQKGEKQKAI